MKFPIISGLGATSKIFTLFKVSNGVKKWILVCVALLIGAILCYVSYLRNSGFCSSASFLLIPISMASTFISISVSTILTIVLILVFILSSIIGNVPVGTTLYFALGSITNCCYLYYQIRVGETSLFQSQKEVDDLKSLAAENTLLCEKSNLIYEANQAKVKKYTALNELAKNLAGALEIKDVVILLIETISKTFMNSNCTYALLLFDSNVSRSLHVVRYGEDVEMEVRLNRERLNPSDPFNEWVIAQGKSLFINDIEKDFRFQNVKEKNDVQSIVAAPLMAGTEMLGLIRMESRSISIFRQEDARLLSSFADLATVALEHVALYHQTIELAITDGLTSLYVQRYYKERVKEEMFRALEHRLPLSLLMVDVDDFKTYNDKYGHLVGDEVLKNVSVVLREAVRTVDLVSRYGGEEFSILLLKTPLSGARIVAERIRQKIEQLSVPVGQQVTHVTVSIGLAEVNHTIKSADFFIELADGALYQAKKNGKNRVCSAENGSKNAKS